VRSRVARLVLLLPVLAYTVFSAGPYLWTATMSLRTTDEIYRSHYGLPVPAHWDKFHRAWTEFGYATYFRNSAIVAVASVLIVTVLGAMAGFAFARKAPLWVSIAVVVSLETMMAVVIRDNLTLNILMLIYPLEAIKQWQLGA